MFTIINQLTISDYNHLNLNLGSCERQQAVSCNALDHSAIRQVGSGIVVTNGGVPVP